MTGDIGGKFEVLEQGFVWTYQTQKGPLTCETCRGTTGACTSHFYGDVEARTAPQTSIGGGTDSRGDPMVSEVQSTVVASGRLQH